MSIWNILICIILPNTTNITTKRYSQNLVVTVTLKTVGHKSNKEFDFEVDHQGVYSLIS